MPLESAAREVAGHLLGSDFVAVYAHHDSDGIAAGAILCHALHRAGIGFRFRVTREVPVVEQDTVTVLCDLGANESRLPRETVVVDHHAPRFDGPFHLNPNLAGIDGGSELSASGTAFLLSGEMGENRDLAGLALLGMIGDRQRNSGLNREILNGGIANGVIEPSRGWLLPGRDDRERLLLAIDPYLPGVSGEAEICTQIVESTREQPSDTVEVLLSRTVLETSRRGTLRAIENIYGTRYSLKRECVEDAHTLVALVDACGKSGLGGLAASLCLRASGGAEEAWEAMRAYRRAVIEAIGSAPVQEGAILWHQVPDPGMTGSVADALAWDVEGMEMVAVFACEGDRCHISLRCADGGELHMGTIAQEIAEACGGTGGGHTTRAGARVPRTELSRFREALERAVA